MTKTYKYVDNCKNLKNKTAKKVNHLAINVPDRGKISVLADVLVYYGGLHKKTIVFTSTKADANELIYNERLKDHVEVLHGDIAQKQREVTLRRFKEDKFMVLVATDVASRGLDIPNVELIVQLEPPSEIETYIHRSGRTARVNNEGTCITFFNKKKNEFQLI